MWSAVSTETAVAASSPQPERADADPALAPDLDTLTSRLPYVFEDPTLLVLALTHRSWCAENTGDESNERLEFLGDSVLGLAVTDELYRRYPDRAEGELAKVRAAVTVLVLVYLVSYVGVNLYTMGQVLNILLGWDIWLSAMLVASISAVYVTAGGQTSVIVTDLFQGVMLLATGILILVLGAHYLGGLDELWQALPRGHRTAFDNFNADPSFPSVGITWQDGIANTAMLYFLNQGMLMRFLSARSVQDGRRAMFAVILVLMPIAACVVATALDGLLDLEVTGEIATEVAHVVGGISRG